MKSYGAIPYRRTDEGVLQVCLMHSVKGHWGLPKGGDKTNAGDYGGFITVITEVREETSQRISDWVNHREIFLKYNVPGKKGLKKVELFIVRVYPGIEPKPDPTCKFNDSDDAAWKTVDWALENTLPETQIALKTFLSIVEFEGL